MPLKPGTQLGSYEILSLIGAGGMGEVYKARDAKLNRMVAIKVLPPVLAGDATLLARFEREAKAVAALSHPNILGIHDLASQDGLTYAVMELLEGDSLRDRLKAGALPPRRAVEIAIELAQGLGAAHDKGIIHRDVKPENIFITKEGRVKVLDFGLAKQVAPRGGLGVLETEAVGAPHATEAGMVLGTAGYMSPEQVRGEAADHRADVFAFGVVLYEMLGGQRPFRGETSAQTMTAILEQDPPALVASRGPLPPALERIAAHCLEKHPEARFQSMKDIAFALQNLSTASSDAPGRVPAARPGRSPLLLVAATVAAMLVLGGLLRILRWPPFAAPAQPTFARLNHTPGTVESACFGPDGRTVYFTERIQGGPPEVFVIHPGSTEPKPLGVRDAVLLGVSPAGDLALMTEPKPYISNQSRGILAQVGSDGGPVKELQEKIMEAAWDGPGFATVTSPDLQSIVLEFGGKVIRRTKLLAANFRYLRRSPDGARFALIESDSNKTEVVLYDRQGRRTVRYRNLHDSGGETFTGLNWGPDGALWFSELEGDQTGIWCLPSRGERRLLWRGQGAAALMDVAPDGRILLADHQTRWGVLLQKAGEARPRDISIANGTQALGFSADGRSLLLLDAPTADGGTNQDQTYLWSVEKEAAVKVAHGTGVLLTPDGRWVSLGFSGFSQGDLDPAVEAAFRAAGLEPKEALDINTPAPWVLFVPVGAGRPFAVALPRTVSDTNWALPSPDGRRIFFNGKEKDLYYTFVMDRAGGAYKAVTPAGFGINYLGVEPLSPDGARLILSDGGGFNTAGEGGTPRPIPGLDPDERPMCWSRDMTGIYVRNRTLPAVVQRVDLASGARRPVFTYQPSDASGLRQVRSIFTTPDAAVFAVNYERRLSSLYLMEGIK